MWHNLSAYSRGLLIAVFGVLVLSPDSATLNLAQAEPFTALFWRSVGMIAVLLALSLILHYKHFFSYLRSYGLLGMMIAPFLTMTQISFVVGVQLTNPSHVLVMLAAIPLCSAIFSRLFLGEKITKAMMLTIFVGMIGVIIMVYDSFGGGNWRGDLLAMVVPISMGLWMTFNRLTKAKDTYFAHAISGLLTLGICLFFVESFAVPLEGIGWLTFNALIVATVPFICIIIALRSIPATEAGLVMLLETLIGPLWVWLALGTSPTRGAAIGGFILLSALVGHAVYRMSIRNRLKRTN